VSGVLLPFSALVAGIVSFSSPCCLPLMPGYLSYVSALPVADLGEREARRVTLRAALLFVAGFTTIFTLLGLGASALGSALIRNQDTLTRWFGVVIVVLGLSTIGLLRLPFLQRERRLDLARVPRGPAWAFPMGMGFAAGWAPCIGPVLATILATASVAGTALWGGILLALYSAGLGIPFVLLALGYHRAGRSMAFLRRHGLAIERLGGALLVVVGVLFLTGRWQEMFRPLQRWFAELGWPPI
jgi:cytochrome c-type biogenesis protein